MMDRSFHGISRRTFLKGAVVTGTLVSLGASHLKTLRAAAEEAGIKGRDWITLPLNDGRTVEAGPHDLGGDLQLLRNADGSYQSSRTFISSVQPVPARFNMVGMHWVADVPPNTDITVEVRGSLDGVRWSGWSSVGHVMHGREQQSSPSAAETFTDAVEMGRANRMQYRITLTTNDPNISPIVQRVTATQIDSLDSPRLEDLDRRGRAIPFRVGNGGPPSARMILRDGPIGWGPAFDASDPNHPLYWPPLAGEYPTEFVTIHHTAGVNNPENPVATVRAIWYYHAVTLGWGDIGYHYLVDQYGNVYQGREGGHATEGGHVFRYNHHNVGVSLLGQFHPGAPGVPPSGEPTREALNSAMRMAALQSAYWHFDPLGQYAYPKSPARCRPQLSNFRICSHRDWQHTASCVRTVCPGDNVYKHLATMRQQAARLIPSIKDLHLMEILKHP